VLRLREYSGGLSSKRLSRMTFENFDYKRANLPLEQRRNLERAFTEARDFAKTPENWLVFLGRNGCGKTHLAAAIGNYQLQRGKPVIFMFVPDLLDHLRSTFNPDSKVTYDEFFERVKNEPLLILDDFGEQASTPWAQEKLYQLINYRYNEQLPMVMTTCLPLEDMETRIGSRLADVRLASVVNILAPDYRSDLAPSEMVERKAGRRGGRARLW
jgi:DNA replication protein DnaC